MKQFAEGERMAYDSLPVLERCAYCPDWAFEGTAAEGRTAALEHRREVHPELTRKRRRKGTSHIGNWRQVLPLAEQKEIADQERTRRMFLLGITPPDAL